MRLMTCTLVAPQKRISSNASRRKSSHVGCGTISTKGIICAELGNLVCARDEWAQLVQVAPNYTPARVNLWVLSGSHMPLAASTSSVLGDKGFAFAR
jgi:hypothetical protein